jgi:hypothetical protein
MSERDERREGGERQDRGRTVIERDERERARKRVRVRRREGVCGGGGGG